jgi:oligo-1,6-glucosidase
MTNFDFTDVSQLNDVESRNVDTRMKKMHIPRWLRWKWIAAASRDNARTPVQWTNGPQAGFTTGKPWLAVNGHYKVINYQAQEADENSVLHYYRRVIALRAGSETLKYGEFTPLRGTRRLMAYTRERNGEKFTVLLNFSGWPLKAACAGELVVSNTARTSYGGTLEPWEAVVLRENKAAEAQP